MSPASAIVVGAGPAGSLAATLLARAGVAVTLIEQSRFPRDKVCGECLSALGLDVLRRHGLFDAVWSAGRPLTRARLHGPNASSTIDLPSPMLGLSRARLDSSLLATAARAGVAILQPARVEAVDDAPDAATVRVRRLTDNAVLTLRADVVLIADGRDALGPRRPAASGDFGVKAHFENVHADPAAVTLYGGLGQYGGVAPVEDGRWNVAFAVPRDRITALRGDLDAWWAAVLDASAAAGRDFAHARRLSGWLASPLPRHAPPKRVAGRIVPIGAAAAAIEPVGGEGMGTVLRSAELAVDAALSEDETSLDDAYATLWRRRGWACRLGGWLMAGESTADLVGLAAHPAVARLATRLAGK